MGRRALAIPTDVRDEDAIRQLIERSVAELGRLDILVNNAGAIWTQPILQTPPKRFDLMMGVNVRAAYIACYYALPHMVKQHWGHILNMCPQLTSLPSPGKVAYMISKLGMARVALGVAAEHERDNIAGNTLWPRTIIETQASIAWKMADRSQWRTPEIVCDASLAIFAQEPRACTGHQWIDEDALGKLAGITNFDGYWCEGKPPANPIYIDKW
jgi:citronellol/citronellal dehydrogenase